MATTTQSRLKRRQAHTSGHTFLSYSPDGSKLVTVGSNNTMRVYKTGFDGEPTNIDECQEQNMGLAATNAFFVAGSEDGTVSKYSLNSMSFDNFLVRSSLPVRDVAVSPDGQWCAVASDEIVVKIINVSEIQSVVSLREHPKPAKHISFDPKGKFVTLSCSDGQVYVYALNDGEPELVRKIDGLIRTVETNSEVCTKVTWHPDARAFVAPTATRDLQVISQGDWEKQRVFTGHTGDITAVAWSPNGSMLASAGKDNKILLWETKTQDMIASYDHANVMDLAWHPTLNLLSFTNTDGQLYNFNDFVPADQTHLLSLGLQSSPFIHDPRDEMPATLRRPKGQNEPPSAQRDGTPNSLDDILPNDLMDDDDDDGFVSNDDDAGYTVDKSGLNGNGKRPGDGERVVPISKRRAFAAEAHEPFQPGSTPWRGNRKYLCLNLTGVVWTIDQDTHNTVTVEFYDHEFHRDFHFTDPAQYDKACLSEHGTLFSCPSIQDQPAEIFYRPNETWTARSDWRIHLPKDEDVIAISLSDSFVTVLTTTDYVRIYTLFGIPYRVYRQKSSPAVTCASWRNYLMTLGNGPVGADGSSKLLYTIENIKRDEVCQSEDIVALPAGATLKSIFFSDKGDPCIYDSYGVLLTLLHWRIPSQAKWVPLLDTTRLSRLASGLKTETYFPIAVADGKFHCIILKGGDRYPYFPRPLLSEFEFDIPIHAKSLPPKADVEDDIFGDDDEPSQTVDSETQRLESSFVLQSLLTAQMQDQVDATRATHSSRVQLTRMELEIDKVLLQMLAVECREGEERGMRALETVSLMRDRTGRMLEAAKKVAERYGQGVLGEKIREVGETMVADEEEEMD